MNELNMPEESDGFRRAKQSAETSRLMPIARARERKESFP